MFISNARLSPTIVKHKMASPEGLTGWIRHLLARLMNGATDASRAFLSLSSMNVWLWRIEVSFVASASLTI
jgi:hypothetical protein